MATRNCESDFRSSCRLPTVVDPQLHSAIGLGPINKAFIFDFVNALESMKVARHELGFGLHPTKIELMKRCIEKEQGHKKKTQAQA